ncbi:MAG: glutathione S-transferase family protein [Alphaproteobacteria bacterium]|nr:glutathione S-transferase family protein [Alphaproteobacteria bacterium]
MIIIHHLGASQSDRVVWLMEELGLPYELKWYHRKADRLAPDDYLALHPAATAPVIQDGDRTLVESAVIVEYICHRHGGGRFTVGPDRPEYYDYLYWMHFNNNLLGLFFGKLALRATPQGPDAQRMAGLIQRRENGYFRHLEQSLGTRKYLAGDDLTCADIMVMFTLSTLSQGLGRSFDDLPNIRAYMKRIEARPAYAKAMTIAGPKATPPG